MSQRELTHAVQHRRLTGTCDLGWHTMAAFDCEIIADRYARECMDDGRHKDFEYRVVTMESLS